MLFFFTIAVASDGRFMCDRDQILHQFFAKVFSMLGFRFENRNVLKIATYTLHASFPHANQKTEHLLELWNYIYLRHISPDADTVCVPQTQ